MLSAMPRKTSDDTAAPTPMETATAPADAPSTLDTVAAPAPGVAAAAAPVTNLGEIQDRLDMVLLYLHQLDRRDKWRTRGGFLKGLVSIIPVLIAVWAAWYFYTYGDILMKKLTTEVVRQSAAYAEMRAAEQGDQFAPVIMMPSDVDVNVEPPSPAAPAADDTPPAEILLPEE